MSEKSKASILKHADYQKEVERLEFTKLYIRTILEASKENKQSFTENIKQAFEDLDYLDSSLSYINILTNAKFLELAENELERLESVLNKPYFSRINFKKQDDEVEEVLYIGKTSLYDRENQMPIIVDWRSPIANVYYDGRLGEVSYEVNGEQRDGYLSLKRQYEIQEGKLKDFHDIDLTTHDELLQKSLSGKADNRLTEIVTTIQKEQNEVIRASLQHPIIVQGAAGSGKTTIALHRISYFLYTFGERFRPEKLMILAPNRLFIDYISDVLPELGVGKINQTTFMDYIRSALGKKIKVIPPEKKLLALVEGKAKDELISRISTFKGSLEFKDVLDAYISDIEKKLAPTEDFFVEKYRLMKATKLKRLFLKEYRYLPVYSRVDKIKQLLTNHVKVKKVQILTRFQERYEEALEKAIYGIKDNDKRRQKVVSLMDGKEKRSEQLQSSIKNAVKTYMNYFEKKDIYTLYQKLMTSEELLATYADGLSEEEVNQLVNYSRSIFGKKAYELEDLAPLFYLKSKLMGLDEKHKMKSVFIDEAQDYSYFQFAALKEGFDTNLFTIVGDLAQGIHAYRGTRSWEPLTEQIFPEANYLTLQKSYRTTVEIMELANDILAIMDEDLPQVEPVVRRGPKPVFHQINPSDQEELASLIERDIRALVEVDLHSIAIIGRTASDCSKIKKVMEKSNLSFQLLNEQEDMVKGQISIVPAYLSKGLEFDAVLMVSIEEPYSEKELDIKLIYVGMTRPMHRLFLYGPDPSSFLLDRVDPIHIEIKETMQKTH
ncbi:RNA polymerase recycling motor HelD [Bacillus sp. ISL-45]|uniref:RNA polymerase recycling motor HelD n=1 Tax=Bacillus sp. ISL-45 TaxID=2819128 RepID=UPI001BE7D28E|nr:RNA polymerase recycling motor HelD [Bacillus sp. ISL-45]MBT2663502.1 UvrD-helicase domain-containing protein [Bacillus sp. ISL-45]